MSHDRCDDVPAQLDLHHVHQERMGRSLCWYVIPSFPLLHQIIIPTRSLRRRRAPIRYCRPALCVFPASHEHRHRPACDKKDCGAGQVPSCALPFQSAHIDIHSKGSPGRLTFSWVPTKLWHTRDRPWAISVEQGGRLLSRYLHSAILSQATFPDSAVHRNGS
jgi:hypothetical protein